MSVTSIHSYLVHPGKVDKSAPRVSGVKVPHTGKLFQMVERLDRDALGECDIDIVFKPAADGTKQNNCRDLLLTHLRKKDLASGLAIASQLQKATSGKPGIGLLFLVTAKDQHGHRLLVARFPADTGVMAEEKGAKLNVTFVEKVFMKNLRAYKSVLYKCEKVSTGFWTGVAVDRQMDDLHGTANYWIGDFLASNLSNTAAQGTKRVASAFQHAIKNEPDPTVREELLIASQMARQQGGRHTSAAKLAQDFRLSEKAQDAFRNAFPRKDLFSATFKFDQSEYNSVLSYRAVSLDSGGTMIANDLQFEKVFHSEQVGSDRARRRYTTEGTVVSTRLQKNAG